MNDMANNSNTTEGESSMATNQDQNEIITYWQREIERLTRELSKDALDVADCFEKERTGVCDGDGSWHGSDVSGYLRHEAIPRLGDKVQRTCQELENANARLLECERIVSPECTAHRADLEIPF